MGKFSSKEILLTAEQKQKLIDHSNTYWKKYDVRLLQVYCMNSPIDSFIVQYKTFIDTNKPEFERFSWSCPRKEMEMIIGLFS